ncbi:S-layer homology domain-containing protein [bacterium]|nr:S-layer homology domain-containing protein [bacterium]
MSKTIYLTAVIILLCSGSAVAQQAFTDVPTDHWAYDAIRTLVDDGIILGYPNGTFGGKRAVTRYEFAVAIARLIQYIPQLVPSERGGVITQEELDDALKDYAKKSEIMPPPSLANLATKQDLECVRKLVDEFRGELESLGVDVDTLKTQVADLTCRVAVLEAEVRRVKFTGDANVFAIANDHRSGIVPAVDLDNRTIPFTATLGRTIGVVRDFDLNVVGRISCSTTANATIDYGNYLNYLVAVDDYVDGVRQTSRNDTRTVGDLTHQFVDAFFPYYAYIDAGICSGNVKAGRFPIQFTPYTLKKIDVDSYTTILKTDDGYYPMDGISLMNNFGGVDITLFAAKNDLNDYLVNGLTGQPRNSIGTFNQLGGNAVGGLTQLVSQTAGGRAVVGIPWSGKAGFTFYQSWSEDEFNIQANYDQARVYGTDLSVPVGMFNFAGSWTQSDALVREGAVGVTDVNDDAIAWDGRFGAMVGKLGVGAGYKSIGRNFTAAGFWDKIGHWANPVNIKGPYADLVYPLMGNLNFVANGEYLTVKDPSSVTGNSALTQNDNIIKAEGGLQWGLSKANSVALGYQWVRFRPDSAALSDATETYLTIGWAYKLNPNTAFNVGYQYINYDGGGNPAGTTFAYGPDTYRAGEGVVQFGVTF